MKEKTALKPIDQFKLELFSQISKLKSNLPASVDPKRFCAATMIAVQNNPDLLTKCTRESLFTAISKCAQDGLMPDGKEAAIIAYGSVATYQSMVYGVIKRIKNSGEYTTVFAEVVYPEDKWEYSIDDNGKHFKHGPDLTAERTDSRILFAYAVVREKGNEDFNIDVMTRAEIDKTRASSRTPNGPGWSKWWGEMAKKTVLRRLSKRVSTSSEFDKFTTQFDEEFDMKEANKTKAELKPSSSIDELSLALRDDVIEIEDHPKVVEETEPAPWELEVAKGIVK